MEPGSKRSVGVEEEKKRIRRSEADGFSRGRVETLRKASRETYLTKRVTPALEAIRNKIEDEESLYRDVKRTESELRQINYMKEACKLGMKVSGKEDNYIEEYRIPEAYDLHKSVDQRRRFAVALDRYKDDTNSRKRFAEQKSWEDIQIGKGSFNFSSRNSFQLSDKYQFVFQDHTLLKSEIVHHEVNLKLEDDKSLFAKIDEDRKGLPVYAFRDKLLQAVHDHQVLIIEGETGCGKTTQIPQFLHGGGYTNGGKKIACTQPRRVAAMSVAARVAREMGVKLGHEVGYSIRFEDCTSDKTILKYMTDGMLLRELLCEPDLASYSVIIIDEAHERTISTDILFGLVKDICCYRPDLKLLISSATLDAVKFSDFFDSAPIFKIPGRRYPYEIYHTKAPVADYLDAVVVTVLNIHVTEPVGDILVFLTGQEEIEIAEEILKDRIKGFGTKIGELVICPIYSSLPTQLQGKIFDPIPEGARKVVLATNIAETSLTIDGIKYVLDSGFCKMKSYHPRSGMESLLVVPISKASANQRAGRCGRTGPGKCFRLYTAQSFHKELEEKTVPEIQRTKLNIVLTLKNLGIHDLKNFEFMDPPPVDALIKALELLFALDALDNVGELTKVGRTMAEFPLDPMVSKMIVASHKYECSNEIISIAAMLSVGNTIFYRPKGKKLEADIMRQNFYTGNVGDHIALLRIYESWKETNYSTQWCYENYIQARTMKQARDIRDQLVGILERVEIELTSKPDDLDAITKSIASGFFPHSAKLQRGGFYHVLKQPHAVYIHPSSGLVKRPPKVVLYHELVLTSKEYMRHVIELKPEWLLEVAPHYYKHKEVQDTKSNKKMHNLWA